MGCVIVIFCQCLGAALGPSIAQNLFIDNLLNGLDRIDGVDKQLWSRQAQQTSSGWYVQN
jgi:hypothetical protein